MKTFLKKVQVFVLVALLSISNLSYGQTLVPAKRQIITAPQEASKIETYWLAMNIYYEAGNQPYLGKVAVGVVTLNRKHDLRWPKTIREVVTQPAQFSWYNPEAERAPKDKARWEECYQIAKLLLTKTPDNVIIKLLEGATFFHAVYVKPDWSRNLDKVVQIGDHIFYRTRNDSREKRT
jgi:spore germination cell wall hydrolase CwlJ-like protein